MNKPALRVFTFWAAMTLGCGGLAGCGGSPSPDMSPPSGGGTSQPGGGSGSGGAVFPEDNDPLAAQLDSSPGEIIVQANPGASANDLQALFAGSCAKVLQELPQINVSVLEVSPASLDSAAERLAESPFVAMVQKNYQYEASRIPDDERFGSQGYLDNIGLAAAWDMSVGDDQVIIAVLDTGVAPDHPDLVAKLVPGWNVFDDNGDTSDVLGHGTAVASIAAAATDNGAGMSGVSWLSPIMPVRVTNAGGKASSRDIAAGLVWAADHGASVANVSFSPLAADRTVQRAAAYFRSFGGLVFISTGNEGQHTTASGSPDAVYVGAINDSGSAASFSNTGPYVDLVAPGTGIVIASMDGGYKTGSGTSFASPIAAGTAALIMALQPELRSGTVSQLLLDNATDAGAAGKDDVYGHGVIDAAAALQAAASVVEASDSAAPTVRIESPAEGQTVEGATQVMVAAADDSELAEVVLYVDGAPYAVDDYAPYAFALSGDEFSSGLHTIHCVARDVAGNEAASGNVRVNLLSSGGSPPADCDDAPPDVTFNFPVDGSEVANRVAIQVTVTDNLGVATIEWRVDGVTVQTSQVAGTRVVDSYQWDAGTATPGAHVLSVRASDLFGGTSTAELQLIKK